jgi:hypothetical protein
MLAAHVAYTSLRGLDSEYSLNAEREYLVDLVKQSVDLKAGGDQGMIEVYRALLLSPV